MRAGNHDTESGEIEDAVWGALANRVRRRMLDVLRTGPETTGALTDHFPDLSRYAVMQHLRVLESAGLVVARRDGRKRYNYLNPVPIQEIYNRWVVRHLQPWTEALLGLRETLEHASRDRRGDNEPPDPMQQ